MRSDLRFRLGVARLGSARAGERKDVATFGGTSCEKRAHRRPVRPGRGSRSRSSAAGDPGRTVWLRGHPQRTVLRPHRALSAVPVRARRQQELSMTTPRDLMFVALDPASGLLPGQGELSLGLAGAELIDLVDAGAAELDGDHIVAVAWTRPTTRCCGPPPRCWYGRSRTSPWTTGCGGGDATCSRPTRPLWRRRGCSPDSEAAGCRSGRAVSPRSSIRPSAVVR